MPANMEASFYYSCFSACNKISDSDVTIQLNNTYLKKMSTPNSSAWFLKKSVPLMNKIQLKTE